MTGDVYLKLLDIAVSEGIEIIDNKLDIENVNGLFIEGTNGSVIALNIKLADNPSKKNFILAHEIGHHELHRGKINKDLYFNDTQYRDKLEDEANKYADTLINTIMGGFNHG